MSLSLVKYYIILYNYYIILYNTIFPYIPTIKPKSQTNYKPHTNTIPYNTT